MNLHYKKDRKKKHLYHSLDDSLCKNADDESICCSNELSKKYCEMMKSFESPLNEIIDSYKDIIPIFSIDFLHEFINFYANSNLNLDEFLFYIINGPIENVTRLSSFGIFQVLYCDLPKKLDILYEILKKLTPFYKRNFYETGGIYIICYFAFNPSFVHIACEMLLSISDQDIDLFNDILPPNAFDNVRCNFDTTIIFEIKDVTQHLFSTNDFNILICLTKSLINIFHSSEKAIYKLGNVVVENFDKYLNYLNNCDLDDPIKVQDIVELYQILYDYFDIEFIYDEFINLFSALIISGNYQIKLKLIPSFLDIISNSSLDFILNLCESSHKNISNNNSLLSLFEEFLSLGETSICIKILEIISDFVSKIVLLSNTTLHEEFIFKCNSLLGQLATNENNEILELAENTIKFLNKIIDI